MLAHFMRQSWVGHSVEVLSLSPNLDISVKVFCMCD